MKHLLSILFVITVFAPFCWAEGPKSGRKPNIIYINAADDLGWGFVLYKTNTRPMIRSRRNI